MYVNYTDKRGDAASSLHLRPVMSRGVNPRGSAATSDLVLRSVGWPRLLASAISVGCHVSRVHDHPCINLISGEQASRLSATLLASASVHAALCKISLIDQINVPDVQYLHHPCTLPVRAKSPSVIIFHFTQHPSPPPTTLLTHP